MIVTSRAAFASTASWNTASRRPSSRLASDERCGGGVGGAFVHREQAVRGHGLGLPLERQRLDRLVARRRTREPPRVLADEDLAGLSRRLRVATRRSPRRRRRRRPSALTTTSPVLMPIFSDSSSCRSDASSSSSVRIASAASTARAASSSCTSGTPNAAITPSPVNFTSASAVPFDLGAHRRVEAVEDRADGLGVHPLLERGRTGQVREQDGDDLARGDRRCSAVAGPPGTTDRPRCRTSRRTVRPATISVSQTGQR